jgi:hypothetical protein
LKGEILFLCAGIGTHQQKQASLMHLPQKTLIINRIFFSKGRARINDQASALSARASFISGARCPTIMKKATSKSNFACESALLMLIDLRNSQTERLIVPVLLKGKGSRPFLFAHCMMENALLVRDALDTSEFD